MAAPEGHSFRLSASHIPNVISGLRIAAFPLLLALVGFEQRPAFSWLLATALLSDILDGAIARHFGYVSKLGSLLDSVADLLTFIAAACGIWRFPAAVLASHRIAFWLLVGFWIGGALAGYLRYGRLASFHTVLSRIAAYVLGIFVVVLFLWGFVPWLCYAAVSVGVISHIEEFILMALLPAWTPNARGLYWVMKRHRGSR
jgi:phosphatidylglycerophosphate synthase